MDELDEKSIDANIGIDLEEDDVVLGRVVIDEDHLLEIEELKNKLKTSISFTEAEDELAGTSIVKRGKGRPSGFKQSEHQREAVSKAAREYQQKLKEGLIVKEPWETHGAFSYIKTWKISKKKKDLLRFIYAEREKWLEDLGGEENLSNIEKSMLDEASRLLLFATMINDYLMMQSDDSVVYKDEDGDFKMHTALSRHYLSFTKNYVSILKELQKIASGRMGKKGSAGKRDIASMVQRIHKEES